MDDLDVGRFSIIGFAGGGPFALAFAHEFPARVNAVALVASVAPVSGPSDLADMSQGERLAFRLAIRWPRLLAGLLYISQKAIRRAGSNQNQPKRLKRIAKTLPEADREFFLSLPFRRYATAEATAFTFRDGLTASNDFRLFANPWAFALREIAVPVEIFHGRLDHTAPTSHAVALAERLPHSTLHLVDALGHLSILDESQAILRALLAHERA